MQIIVSLERLDGWIRGHRTGQVLITSCKSALTETGRDEYVKERTEVENCWREARQKFDGEPGADDKIEVPARI